MAEVFSNWGYSTISGAVTAGASSLSVAAGTGVRFPTTSGSDFFICLLLGLTTGNLEVIKVTNRSTDTFTIERAQEDIFGLAAAAAAFEDGDIIYNVPGKAFFEGLMTAPDHQDATHIKATGGGSANVHTAAFTPTVTAYDDGMMLLFKPVADNTGAATLNVDTLGATAIKKVQSGSLVDVEAGDLDTDGYAVVIYQTGSPDHFLLLNPKLGTAASYDVGTSTGQIPLAEDIAGLAGSSLVGEVKEYAGASLPTGFLWCNGETIGDVGSGADNESADYETLFDLLKGAGYGNTGSEVFASGHTVLLPDCRGRVVAGRDDMGGSSANRLTDQSGGLDGDTLGDAGGSETHTLAQGELPSHTHGNGSLSASSSGSGHSHDIDFVRNPDSGGNGGVAWDTNLGNSRGESTEGGGTHSHNISGSTSSTGSGNAHNNVQPTIILNKIIAYQ